MATCLPSIAEARHWRHLDYYGYYGVGRSQGEDRVQVPARSNQSRDKTNGFGADIVRMIHACEEDSEALKKTPFEAIARTVRPNATQQDALHQMRNAILGAGEKLSANCPKDVPPMLSNRLTTLSHALEAMAASRDGLRESLTNFYAQLDDEQKARVVVNIASSTQSKSDPASGASSRVGNIDGGPDSPCHQWVATLRSWPVKQIDAEVDLLDAQHAAFYEVAAAMYQAAGSLIASCPNQDLLTPLGRLETQQSQLTALRRGIDVVQLALARFENLLTDAQKARLGAVVDKSPSASAPLAQAPDGCLKCKQPLAFRRLRPW
jgi:hypothetical protein